MTDDDFLSELRIVPFDTGTVKRQAKEEFFVRRLGEIESGMRLDRQISGLTAIIREREGRES